MEVIGDDYAQNYVGIRAGGALLVWMRLLQVRENRTWSSGSPSFIPITPSPAPGKGAKPGEMPAPLLVLLPHPHILIKPHAPHILFSSSSHALTTPRPHILPSLTPLTSPQVLYISTNAGLQLLMTISMLFDLGSYFFISLAVLAAQ